MSPRASVLVTAEELHQILARDAGAVHLLDVRWTLGEPAGAGRERYLDGHLPGARFLDLEAVLTRPSSDRTLGRHPLPDAMTLERGLGELGVGTDRQIVVYDEAGSFAAGRAWWVLGWAGLDVRVLDGGIAAWLGVGGRLESGEAILGQAAELRLATGNRPVIDADAAGAFPTSGTLIDVRAAERFRGEVEPIDARAGHIPGAINVPVARLFDAEGRLPDEASLREILGSAVEGPIAVYCGSGVSAAQLILGLATLGIEAPLYPPSWSGWSANPDRPIAVGA